MRVARCDIHLVPPTETNQATTGDVFEIVEIRGEKEQRQDEDEDTVTVLAREYSRRNISKRYIQILNEKNSKQVHQESSNAKSQETDEGDGMGAETPVQVSLLRLRGVHDVRRWRQYAQN